MSTTTGNGRKKPVRRAGRQPSITATQIDTLCERLAEGHTEAASASAAAIPITTLTRWKQRGREADDHMAAWLADQPDNWADEHTFDELWTASGLTANDRQYWSLWSGLTRARETAVQHAVDDIRRAGEPHDEETTYVVQRDVLVKTKDADGNERAEVQTLVESRTTVRHNVVDWKARAWWLERQRRDDFGRVETIKHDGAMPVRFEGVDIDDEIETLLSGGKNRE